MPPPVAVSWHDVLRDRRRRRGEHQTHGPYEKRYVRRRRAMNMYERQNDKIVRISARAPRIISLSFSLHDSPHRVAGEDAHVRRRNGRAISVDMRCLKTATIPEMSARGIRIFPPLCDVANKGTRGKSGNYIPARDNAIEFLTPGILGIDNTNERKCCINTRDWLYAI